MKIIILFKNNLINYWNMLIEIKNFLKKNKIDFLLLPNSDEFFSEYLPDSKRYIKEITNFSGSNATVIFGVEKSFFFTKYGKQKWEKNFMHKPEQK